MSEVNIIWSEPDSFGNCCKCVYKEDYDALTEKLRIADAAIETWKFVITELADERTALRAEVQRLALGHARYEYVRCLRAAQFAELLAENVGTGTHFDDLVDRERAKK
jgi:hypothetical protein